MMKIIGKLKDNFIQYASAIILSCFFLLITSSLWQNKNIIVSFDAETVKDITYQAFYTEEKGQRFNGEQSIKKGMKAGKSNVEIVLPIDKIVKFRLDIDSRPEKVIIKNLKIIGDNIKSLKNIDAFAFHQIDNYSEQDGIFEFYSDQSDPYIVLRDDLNIKATPVYDWCFFTIIAVLGLLLFYIIRTDRLSNLSIALISFELFIFNFWLFYPGYLSSDWVNVMGSLSLDNWHPIMYPYLFKKLISLFGYHIYYALLFNLIPLYLGIYFIILGFWKRFQSKWCLLGILLIFIGNIFFQNIILHSSFSSPMFVFLLWSIVLYQLLVGITYKNSIILFCSFIFAILSRHNAIIQVYPIFFIYAYLYIQRLKNCSLLRRFTIYIGLLFIFAGFSVLSSVAIPKIVQERVRYPSNHIFLHQIAGACVPHNDESCFKPEWYKKGKTYSDVETLYNMHPLFADTMILLKDSPMIINDKLNGLFAVWLDSILKYPNTYFNHIGRFITVMWHRQPIDLNLSLSQTYHTAHPAFIFRILNHNRYSANELFYESSRSKVQIYNFLKSTLLNIPTIFFVVLNYIMFFVLGIIFWKKQNKFILYSLSSSIAGIAGSIIFCWFAPVADSRYVYPVLINFLTSIVGITAYLADEKRQQQINLKYFILKYKKIIILIMVSALFFIAHAYMCKPLKTQADIYTEYSEKPLFVVYNYMQDFRRPSNESDLLKKENKRGVILQKFGTDMNFTIIALQDAEINIDLQDVDESEDINKDYNIKYTDLQINGKQILPKPIVIEHNEKFTHVLKAKKNSFYKIQLRWHKKIRSK